MKQKKQKTQFKIGDFVTVAQIPPGLKNVPGLNTVGVFERALGKAFPIKGFERNGDLALLVTSKRSRSGVLEFDTIWIEPEFVIAAKKPPKRTRKI
ncbi:MAG: hypothetical protein NT105_15420 [Verrucomicrobia bacterium]|nr:hypothetical protein [Verrucomicrobiota bacterium]